jgi:hypothetical protein
MFDWNSSSTSVRNEGVTWEAYACVSSQSLKQVWTGKTGGTKEWGGRTREGHVTPSFLTDVEEEFQSNIDLGKSRLIIEFYLDISLSHCGVTWYFKVLFTRTLIQFTVMFNTTFYSAFIMNKYHFFSPVIRIVSANLKMFYYLRTKIACNRQYGSMWQMFLRSTILLLSIFLGVLVLL